MRIEEEEERTEMFGKVTILGGGQVFGKAAFLIFIP